MAKDNQNKPDMRRYDSLGLVEQLLESEKDRGYTLGAMEDYGERLSEDALREGYNEQLRLDEKGSGLELTIKAHSKKYKANREKTTLGEFCNIYSVDDYIRSSLVGYSKMTIGDIEKKYESLTEIAKSKSNFTKEQKEEAKKELEKYNPIMAKIKLVEDKRFAQLKIRAIDRTKQDMIEDESKEEDLEKAA